MALFFFSPHIHALRQKPWQCLPPNGQSVFISLPLELGLSRDLLGPSEWGRSRPDASLLGDFSFYVYLGQEKHRSGLARWAQGANMEGVPESHPLRLRDRGHLTYWKEGRHCRHLSNCTALFLKHCTHLGPWTLPAPAPPGTVPADRPAGAAPAIVPGGSGPTSQGRLLWPPPPRLQSWRSKRKRVTLRLLLLRLDESRIHRATHA